MSLSPFQLEVLNWVLMDYEAPHTIAKDISREIGRPVSEVETLNALVALAEAGLVQAFVYEDVSQRYEAIELGRFQSAEEVWFAATPKGRAEVERYAG